MQYEKLDHFWCPYQNMWIMYRIRRKYDLFLYYDHLSDKAGGFLFGKIAPMVERWIEAPRGIGSTPILPTLQEGSSAG